MIIFLYGPDDFRAKRKLKELKDKFRREIDAGGTDLALIDGEKSALERINDLAGPASLFSKKRMAVIENIFSNKSSTLFGELLKFLKKSGDSDNIIIFIDEIFPKDKFTGAKNDLFKFLCAQKYFQEFKFLSQPELAEWVKAEAAGAGAAITSGAAGLLAALSENLWQIHNELKKLVAFKKSSIPAKTPAGIVIEEKDVEIMTRGRLDANIFSLTDSIGAGNKASALKLLEEQLKSGAAETYLLSMILRQFKIIIQIRQAIDSGAGPGSIASLLKLHPFIVRKGISQARFFTLEALKEIISRLVRMDYDLKTGRGDLKTGLALLIAGLK
jgi:DNA polymerase-3 subunit delta